MARKRKEKKAAALVVALVVIFLSSIYLSLIYRAVNLALVNSRMKFHAAAAQELAEAGAAIAVAKINANPAYQGEKIIFDQGIINISTSPYPDKRHTKILSSAVFPQGSKLKRRASYQLILKAASE
ncbi:MAG: hypothetical protein AMS15_09115 [Planctomycetes bacterium DG_23]|nr:MAG: hypothetical protein AMS15_09115 [Planctomycetes bacterium DG_23]